MREIKFRGRDRELFLWRYGDLDTKSSPDLVSIIDDCDYAVDPDTVGQFTGLKDHKGREIYEGDIVKCDSGRICKVVFFTSASACCFDLFPVGGFDCEPPKELTLWKALTVIGNVHDNPELLEAHE